MKNVFVQPARTAGGEPLLVRDPTSRIPLDLGGEWKALTPFWIRRLRDGDVVEATPPQPEAAPAATKAKETRSSARSRAAEQAGS